MSWLAVLAFVHFRLGWGLYWTWDARGTLHTILLLFGPPAAVEAWIRIRRYGR